MEIKEIARDAEERMQKAVESTRSELTKIRTGKASPALLDTIKVRQACIGRENEFSTTRLCDVKTALARASILHPHWERPTPLPGRPYGQKKRDVSEHCILSKA